MSELPVIDDYARILVSGQALMDVRAPVEFTRGAFPASVNLPLMNDSERHDVGIRYKEAGQQAAIDLGAQLVTDTLREQRIARWCAFAEANPGGALYCFRGGLRSRIAQGWLADAGHRLPLVTGGYKALRTFVIDALAEACSRCSFLLIGGRTGSGKTLIIRELERAIDLEQMAGHRGSSFGRLLDEQPSNIDFENAFTIELLRMLESVPAVSGSAIALEDEARLIGRVCIPETLRQSMERSPAVLLETPMEQRIDIAMDDYVIDLLARYGGMEQGFERFAEHHRSSLARVQKRLGGVHYQVGLALLEAALWAHREHGEVNEYRNFIDFILSHYYDPMYDYQLRRKQRRIVFRGDAAAVLEWVRQHQHDD